MGKGDGGLTYADMLRTGLTPRRLEWWTQKGWLRAYDVSPGSGRQRIWLPGEDRVASRMVRYADAGLSPDAACLAARGEPIAPDLVLVDRRVA